jgi:VWFA-related protein
MLARNINRWLAIIFCPAMALSQNAANPPETTIRVSSRIVYVDVVVRDRSGQIIPGLTQRDFRLEEDGKPQTITFFSAHTHDMAAAARLPEAKASAPGKPSGPTMDFSNLPLEGEQPGAVNIILFDLANTAAEDQIEAHQQLVKFLRALPSGQKVALFALTDKLTMIQNFTSSSDRLVAAARQIDPKDAGFILSKASQAQAGGGADEFALQSGGGPGGGAMAHQIEINNAVDNGSRTRITVAAFEGLARKLAAYPGRKNLLWLAESFPIALGAQVDERKNDSSPSFTSGAREAAGLIATAQIAIYPISLLGLEAEGVGSAASGVGQVHLGGGNGDTTASQFNARQALKAAMNDIADQTGGEAFSGSNDFAQALHRSMGDGSNYYTLAYQPSNHNWNGHFRKLHVELTKGGFSLSYRRGYFALVDASQPGTDLTQLNAALQPGMPESTMLSLRSRLELSQSAPGIVRVSSVVSAQNLSLVSSEDGQTRGRLLVLLVAFNDAAGTTHAGPPPQTSAVLNLNFDSKQYQAVLANGITFTQQLKLPPGRYRLRLGVSDLGAHRLGTLDMQVEVGAPSSLTPPAG